MRYPRICGVLLWYLMYVMAPSSVARVEFVRVLRCPRSKSEWLKRSEGACGQFQAEYVYHCIRTNSGVLAEICTISIALQLFGRCPVLDVDKSANSFPVFAFVNCTSDILECPQRPITIYSDQMYQVPSCIQGTEIGIDSPSTVHPDVNEYTTSVPEETYSADSNEDLEITLETTSNTVRGDKENGRGTRGDSSRYWKSGLFGTVGILGFLMILATSIGIFAFLRSRKKESNAKTDEANISENAVYEEIADEMATDNKADRGPQEVVIIVSPDDPSTEEHTIALTNGDSATQNVTASSPSHNNSLKSPDENGIATLADISMENGIFNASMDTTEYLEPNIGVAQDRGIQTLEEISSGHGNYEKLDLHVAALERETTGD